MIKFLHIGFPKCLSTSLQRCFFSKHPDIHYYGIGIKNNIDYINSNLSNLMEVYIRYASRAVFNENKKKFKFFVNKKLSESRKKGFKAAGISSEIMSFGLSASDNDRYEKARRLSYIFGKNTKIIILIRRQQDLLKSLYKESIRIGYKRTYKEYINFHYKFNCRSIVSDMRYEDLFKVYSKFFGAKNIYIIPFESIVSENKQLIYDDKKNYLLSEKLNKILKLPHFKPKFENYNKSLNDNILYHKRILNFSKQHELSNDQYDLIESHRIIKYFHKLGLSPIKKDPYSDVKKKRSLIKKSLILSKLNKKKISYDIEPSIHRKLNKYFKHSNKKLNRIINYNLKKYGYIC